MKQKWKKPRKSKGKSRMPKATGGLIAPASQLRVYPFKFRLPTQYITNDPGTAGLMALSANGGQAPLNNTNIVMKTAQNGFSNFWDIAIATSFQVSNIANAADFLQIFDSYKLGKVTLKLSYLNNVSATNTPGLLPTVYSYFDPDDSVVPPTLLSISGKQGVKVQTFGNKGKVTHTVSLKPVTNTFVVTSSGSVPAAVTNKPMWLDCAVPNVSHYALKMYITDVYLPAGAATQAFRFDWQYNVGFRSPILSA